MGTLYVVATPIGNLEDITIRAIKTLLTTPVVACEDTRRTGLLIKILAEKYKFLVDLVPKKYVSIRDWNEVEAVDKVLRELEENDVALVSDAGTPLISDPGYKLVKRAREHGIKVVPIPGPSAAIAALSASGLPTNKFMFWGFLPKKWELLPEMTHVIYENSLRLPKLLNKIRELHPDSKIVVASEMTKIHESFTNEKVRGEVTVLVYRGEERVPDHGDGDGDVHNREDGRGNIG